MFFFLVFLLYGGIQLYFSTKAIHAFALAGPVWLLVNAWALLMALGPLLLWRMERWPRHHAFTVAVAWIVFSWMGFSFLFVWLGLAVDVYAGAARLADLPMLPVHTAFLLLVSTAMVLWMLGFYSARHPKVERLTIISDKLPSGFRGLRIVQISDLHLGILIGRQRLGKLLAQIRNLQPDLLVSTGDLVDGEAHYLDGLSDGFAACHPRYGKFAVTGNHEQYAGIGPAVAFHARAGFRLLRGESVTVADAITLAGVDDPAVAAGHTDEQAVLAQTPANRFVILLKHQPVTDPAARFDLQLSGHTHNGQIFPFGLLVKLFYPMIQGRHFLPGGGQLYVSRGTGTWGPPIRILAPPEITLIELKRP
ncbi:MAG: metallophosphoesterase [Thiobacillaceae bacterium]